MPKRKPKKKVAKVTEPVSHVSQQPLQPANTGIIGEARSPDPLPSTSVRDEDRPPIPLPRTVMINYDILPSVQWPTPIFKDEEWPPIPPPRTAFKNKDMPSNVIPSASIKTEPVSQLQISQQPPQLLSDTETIDRERPPETLLTTDVNVVRQPRGRRKKKKVTQSESLVQISQQPPQPLPDTVTMDKDQHPDPLPSTMTMDQERLPESLPDPDIKDEKELPETKTEAAEVVQVIESMPQLHISQQPPQLLSDTSTIDRERPLVPLSRTSIQDEKGLSETKKETVEVLQVTEPVSQLEISQQPPQILSDTATIDRDRPPDPLPSASIQDEKVLPEKKEIKKEAAEVVQVTESVSQPQISQQSPQLLSDIATTELERPPEPLLTTNVKKPRGRRKQKRIAKPIQTVPLYKTSQQPPQPLPDTVTMEQRPDSLPSTMTMDQERLPEPLPGPNIKDEKELAETKKKAAEDVQVIESIPQLQISQQPPQLLSDSATIDRERPPDPLPSASIQDEKRLPETKKKTVEVFQLTEPVSELQISQQPPQILSDTVTIDKDRPPDPLPSVSIQEEKGLPETKETKKEAAEVVQVTESVSRLQISQQPPQLLSDTATIDRERPPDPLPSASIQDEKELPETKKEIVEVLQVTEPVSQLEISQQPPQILSDAATTDLERPLEPLQSTNYQKVRQPRGPKKKKKVAKVTQSVSQVQISQQPPQPVPDTVTMDKQHPDPLPSTMTMDQERLPESLPGPDIKDEKELPEIKKEASEVVQVIESMSQFPISQQPLQPLSDTLALDKEQPPDPLSSKITIDEERPPVALPGPSIEDMEHHAHEQQPPDPLPSASIKDEKRPLATKKESGEVSEVTESKSSIKIKTKPEETQTEKKAAKVTKITESETQVPISSQQPPQPSSNTAIFDKERPPDPLPWPSIEDKERPDPLPSTITMDQEKPPDALPASGTNGKKQPTEVSESVSQLSISQLPPQPLPDTITMESEGPHDSPSRASIKDEEWPPAPTPITIVMDNDINPELLANFPSVKPRVPAIFFHHPLEFGRHLKKIAELKINMYLPRIGYDSTKIKCDSYNDHKKLVQYADEHSLPYHTFGYPENRKLKVVIKGLPTNINVEEVKDELRYFEIPVDMIHKMHTKGNKNHDYILALVTLPHSSAGLKILKVTQIFGYDVTLEPLNRKTRQCHRCQKWGHAERYCHGRKRCVKCGGFHITSDCTRDPSTTVPPKCANCGWDHTSNYRKCDCCPDSASYKESQSKKLNDPSQIRKQLGKKLLTLQYLK